LTFLLLEEEVVVAMMAVLAEVAAPVYLERQLR
jgi:Tfp pilus assembly protein PilE